MANNYQQTSYREHEYFSVSKGSKNGDKYSLYINAGKIYHFNGKAERVGHGIQGALEGVDPAVYYQDLILNRTDGGKGNFEYDVPVQEYDDSLLVGDGDKLYLQYTAPANNTYSPLSLPIVTYTLLIDNDYRNLGKMEINYLTYKDFEANYSIETDYLESFESNSTNATFNFLIAEFSESNGKLVKKQIHSGLIFMPRIFRMNKNVF